MGATSWLFWIGGGLLGAAGLAGVLWSLLGDRLRGGRVRRRCPKCWYDMNGVPGLTCPECGREAKEERGLHRSRRRWRWAVVGVLIMAVGAGSMVTPGVRARGWVSLIPTAAVILYYTGPWHEGLPPWHNNLLYERISKGTIPLWQRRLLFRRLDGMLGGAGDADTKVWALRMIEAVAYRSVSMGGTGGGPTGEATDAAPVVIRAMRDDDARVRAFATAIADLVGGDPAPLVAALMDRAATDPDGEVRRKAVWGLHTLAPHASGAVEAIISAVEFEGTPYLQRDALYTLGMLDPSTAERSLPTLIAALGSADIEKRRAAAESLGRLGPAAAGAVRALADCLARDEDFVARREAAQALGHIGAGEAAEQGSLRAALESALEDENQQVRGRAFVSLHALAGADGADEQRLRAYLGTREPMEAAGMVTLLHRQEHDASPYARWLVPRLREEHSRHWSERMDAAKLLCEIGYADGDALEAARALGEGAENDRVRVWAAVLAAQAGGDRRSAVPALIAVIRRNVPPKGPNARADAAEALALIGPGAEAALPLLEAMLEEPAGPARENAKRAIHAITGEPLEGRLAPSPDRGQ